MLYDAIVVWYYFMLCDVIKFRSYFIFYDVVVNFCGYEWYFKVCLLNDNFCLGILFLNFFLFSGFFYFRNCLMIYIYSCDWLATKQSLSKRKKTIKFNDILTTINLKTKFLHDRIAIKNLLAHFRTIFICNEHFCRRVFILQRKIPRKLWREILRRRKSQFRRAILDQNFMMSHCNSAAKLS